MRILVLGGNGYLGSKIVRELVKTGNEVVCTKRVKSNLSRLEDLNDKITWIPASLDAIETAIQYTSFDYVLNMACNYGRSNVLYDGVIEANIEFPLVVLNKLVDCGTKNFLTIGTGLPDDFNMYSFSKKMFAEFGKFYAQQHEINFYELQLEMFYGADEPADRFLPSVIRKMIRGESVETTIGTQKRDVIAVEDIVKAILMVMESDLKGYQVIPVGTGIAPTISEILDYIWKETGEKAELCKGKIAMRKNEPDCIADISKIQEVGAWNPIPWKDGIREMIIELKEQVK